MHYGITEMKPSSRYNGYASTKKEFEDAKGAIKIRK
jgi:hypothetical protein